MKRNSYLNRNFRHKNLLALVDFLESLVDGWDLNIVCFEQEQRCYPFGYVVFSNREYESIVIAEIYGLHRLLMDNLMIFAKSKEDVFMLLDVVKVFSDTLGENDTAEAKFAQVIESKKKETHKVL